MAKQKTLPPTFSAFKTKVTNLDTANTRLTSVINKLNSQKLKDISTKVKKPIEGNIEMLKTITTKTEQMYLSGKINDKKLNDTIAKLTPTISHISNALTNSLKI